MPSNRLVVIDCAFAGAPGCRKAGANRKSLQSFDGVCCFCTVDACGLQTRHGICMHSKTLAWLQGSACLLQGQMADPNVAGNATEFQKVAKAAAELEDQVSAYDRYKATQAALKEAKELLRESEGGYCAAEAGVPLYFVPGCGVLKQLCGVHSA